MRSRAHLREHPIHPMLVPFPIAFLVGAVAADLAGMLAELDDMAVVGWYLLGAGVLTGIVAAIPGLVDYVYVVPPRSSGKRRATKHMMVNLTAIALFALAWWLRGGPGVTPDPALVALETVAAGALGVGGWMGGTLAYRNQIGVSHRYAGSGRWSEIAVEPDVDGWAAVARLDELEINQMKLVRAGHDRIVLGHSDSGWVAFSDHCTHRGGSLAGGTMTCDRVACPWHGSQFDVRTGAATAGPAEQPIRTYPVEVRGDEVRIRVRQ